MKKFFALILVLALVALVTMPALADTYTYSVDDLDVNNDGYVTSDGDLELPYLEASKDGGQTWSPAARVSHDGSGERIAFTCRDFLFPDIKQNEDMSDKDWKDVEQTSIMIRMIVPTGGVARVFGYTVNKDDSGVISSASAAGGYEFSITNGEVVIWIPGQLANANSDLLVRILHQADNGNFDVNHELAVKYVTKDIMSLLPDDFIAERGIKTTAYLTVN